MTSGGPRNRGRIPDPTSGRSDVRGYTLQSLPTQHKIRAPKWPLDVRKVMVDDYFDGKKCGKIEDSEETQRVAKRELELWKWAWRQPQAAAWILETESFRIPIVAMWVRTFVICESGEATAADKGSIHRFADQIGMTTAGLAEMGWKIVEGDGSGAPKVTATVASPESDAIEGETLPSNVRRLRA